MILSELNFTKTHQQFYEICTQKGGKIRDGKIIQKL